MANKISQMQKQKRIDDVYELICSGYRDSEIVALLKPEWGVSQPIVSLYIRRAKAEISRIFETTRRDVLMFTVTAHKARYKALVAKGKDLQASLVLQMLENRLIGKPAQQITVEHINTQPRTVININGSPVNLSIEALELPVELPLEMPVEMPLEVKWYEIGGQLPLPEKTSGVGEGSH